MRTKISNPFVTGGYISPEYFCDRQEESEHLIRAIHAKRNITLISLRRMGKTGLLRYVAHLITQPKQKPAVIYVDLMPTMNGNELLNSLSSALLRLRQHEKGF
jgi:predicted AAA+ superfamily ATPase